MKFLLIVLLVTAFDAGCSDKPKTPSPPDLGVPPGTEKIAGTERIGWDQQAGSSEELATIRYLIYVDANATEVQDVSCSTIPGPAGYSCSGRLPPMSSGPHTLAMAAYLTSGETRLESPLSSSLLVVLTTQTTTSSPPSGSLTVTTGDGVQLQGTVVAEGLVEPSDLASAPDGRLFIAERNGRIRVLRDGQMQPGRAITLPETTTQNGQGLLALAIDPQYEHNHFLYAIYTTTTGFRLARLRAVGDTLGDRAILMDGVPSSASTPTAAIRFGPDGKLYVGFDDAGEPRHSGDLGSFNGKILRLNTDATTPADQPGASPVFTANISTPRGLDWDSTGTVLWIADGSDGLINVRSGDRLPASRYSLPGKSAATALTVYRAELIKRFQGNLLVATDGGHALLRVGLANGDPTKVVSVEELLNNTEPARAIAVGRDGAIYVATNSALVKLSP